MTRQGRARFPDGFRLADTFEARDRRKAILNIYRLNPGLKGNHDEVLLQNWTSTTAEPLIVVGSLSSAAKVQGRISESDWAALRRQWANATQEQIANIRKQYRPRIEAGSPIPFKTTDELAWIDQQRDPNSVTVFYHRREEISGGSYGTVTARKIIYHKGFLVVVNLVVDSARPSALSTLQDLLSVITIKSI